MLSQYFISEFLPVLQPTFMKGPEVASVEALVIFRLHIVTIFFW